MRLSYVLATIKTDVALEQSLEELPGLAPSTKRLAVYREYDAQRSKSWSPVALRRQAEGDKEGAAPAAAIETDYRCILDEAEFDEWLERFAGGAAVCLRHRDHQSRLYGNARRWRLLLPSSRARRPTCPSADYLGAPVQLTEPWCWASSNRCWKIRPVSKVGQNLGTIATCCSSHGIELQGIA